MNDRQSKYFFLGANTADGFYSLYDSLAALDKDDFLWILKGGAGCGKSSFMRMIANAARSAGMEIEYIACSGDPDSLDGIYIPALKTAYMDGTAPHIADVKLAAVNSAYIDLGRFYDIDALAEKKAELTQISRETSLRYKKAYAILASAGALKRGWLPTLVGAEDAQSAAKRVNGIIKRELGTRHREGGTITRRFLSGLTCQGLRTFKATAQSICGKFFMFESRLGLAGQMLDMLAQSAYSSGFDVFVCPDPLTPEVPEAVFIPAVSLGFVASDSALSKLPISRRIHLDPKYDGAAAKIRKSELMRYEKAISSLKDEAFSALSEAKSCHDEMERIYNPYVDFEGVSTVSQEHIKRLGL